MTLQQVVSRENAEFSLTTSIINVGEDGNVYLGNWDQSLGNSYVMRIGTNGSGKVGSVLNTEALTSVAANANGIIATAHGHYAHCVNIYNSNFQLLASNDSFNGVNFDAPADVEVGDQSGDFYALDQWNNRIVRLSGQSGSYGQIVATYYYPTPPATIYAFRVSEKNNLFYLVNSYYQGVPPSTAIVALNMTTLTQQWSLSLTQTGISVYSGVLGGGLAVDNSGTLYTLAPEQYVINEWSSSGSASGSLTLSLNPGLTLPIYGTLQVSNGQVITRVSELYGGGTVLAGAQYRTVRSV